jgi:hypothetical protein
MNNYVAKVNGDGTFDLYKSKFAIGMDFSPVQVLELSNSNVNATQLHADLEELQAKVDALDNVAASASQTATDEPATDAQTAAPSN